MENASKALYIAGSLLIALLVISLLVYTFNNLGGVEEQKDEIAYEESITAFNREYEAFNKRIMYGVDVISCINKAVSNNEKYVKGGNWASGGASGEEAIVQVEVLLANELQESFQIYYVNEKNKESKLYEIDKNIQNTFRDTKIKDFFDLKDTNLLTEIDVNKNLDTIFGENPIDWVTNVTITLEQDEITLDKGNLKGEDYYFMHLLTNNKKKTQFTTGPESLMGLVKYANNLEMIAVNEDDNKIWSSVKWTTALADFKKRKFSCYEINYNEDTGRIDTITFVEK